MPKHIARLVLLIVVCAVGAIAAKAYFTADSFYRYGHYRADSVPKIAAMDMSYQLPKSCTTCHAPRLAEWTAGAHKPVLCEVCHGAAPGHPDKLKVVIPSDTNRLCTQCHEKTAGRPLTAIRQIESSQHHPSPQCITCHNPHSPKMDAVAPTPAELKEAAAAATTCAACHGARGTATQEIWPNLAGQNPAYVARSIGAFKTGTRKDDTMSAMAQGVADEDVPKLAAYFSSLSCTPGKHGGGNAAAGKEIAARQCASCHGANGRPVNPAWPRLAGQNASYLGSALTAFKAGKRDNIYMASAVRDLSDTDIANVATYFAGLSCAAPSK